MHNEIFELDGHGLPGEDDEESPHLIIHLNEHFYAKYYNIEGAPPFTSKIRSESINRQIGGRTFATLQSYDLVELTCKTHDLFYEKQEQWGAEIQES